MHKNTNKMCYVYIYDDIWQFVIQTQTLNEKKKKKTRVPTTGYMKVPTTGTFSHIYNDRKKQFSVHILPLFDVAS